MCPDRTRGARREGQRILSVCPLAQQGVTCHVLLYIRQPISFGRISPCAIRQHKWTRVLRGATFVPCPSADAVASLRWRTTRSARDVMAQELIRPTKADPPPTWPDTSHRTFAGKSQRGTGIEHCPPMVVIRARNTPYDFLRRIKYKLT
jgi:hypothetical protein